MFLDPKHLILMGEGGAGGEGVTPSRLLQTILLAKNFWWIYKICQAELNLKASLKAIVGYGIPRHSYYDCRNRAIVLFVVWFSVSTSYYGITYYVPNLSGDRSVLKNKMTYCQDEIILNPKLPFTQLPELHHGRWDRTCSLLACVRHTWRLGQEATPRGLPHYQVGSSINENLKNRSSTK